MSGLASSTKPVFQTLEWRPGNPHIVIADRNGIAAVERLLATPGIDHAGITMLLLLANTEPRPGGARVFADMDGVLGELARIFGDVPMGAQLSLAGSEALIAQATRHALGLGMALEAIRAERCGPPTRSVQCVHCKTIHHAVAKRILTCSRCDLTLVVRDHFSRRLAAYQAVITDPEDPRFADLRQQGFE